MSRSQRRRRRGRPYQPLPSHRSNAWIVRLVVVMVGAALVIGSLALFGSLQ
jgi:hypothetical protein